jgi:hypothetical protein
MAKSIEGESGWSGLLIDLIRNFLLLRDIFGYLLPGIVFLLMGTLVGRFSVLDWLDKLDLGFWSSVIVFVIMALVAGHILVAISYIPGDIRKLMQPAEKVHKNPSELTPVEIEGRARFPGLFLEYDRRTTQTLMTSGLAMALLLTGLMVYWPGLRLRYIALGASAVLLFNVYTGRKQLGRAHAYVLKAIEDVKEHGAGSPNPPAGS